MDKRNRNRLTGWGDYVTSTISVTLVLFILGFVGVINITFEGVNRQVKEKMGFTIILTDSVPQTVLDSMRVECGRAAYVSEYKYMSAEDVMAEETKGEGADLVELLGVNPYAPMIEVRLRADYANVDSVSVITEGWKRNPAVEEVSVNTEMIMNLNRNANLINAVLVIIAGALLLISFVLINNTVRLTVYARRFLIHTMKLVGATGGFIRRPFLVVNACEGVVAGVLASCVLAAFVGWSRSLGMGLEALLPWDWMAFVFAGLVILGVIICVVAALFATNRYLRNDYDDMFD